LVQPDKTDIAEFVVVSALRVMGTCCFVNNSMLQKPFVNNLMPISDGIPGEGLNEIMTSFPQALPLFSQALIATVRGAAW
jgi:hypothetical protein